MTGYILSRLIQLLLAAVGLCHADSFPISAPVLQRTRHGAESPRIYCSFSMHGAAAALGAHKLMLAAAKTTRVTGINTMPIRVMRRSTATSIFGKVDLIGYSGKRCALCSLFPTPGRFMCISYPILLRITMLWND